MNRNDKPTSKREFSRDSFHENERPSKIPRIGQDSTTQANQSINTASSRFQFDDGAGIERDESAAFPNKRNVLSIQYSNPYPYNYSEQHELAYVAYPSQQNPSQYRYQYSAPPEHQYRWPYAPQYLPQYSAPPEHQYRGPYAPQHVPQYATQTAEQHSHQDAYQNVNPSSSQQEMLEPEGYDPTYQY